MARVGGAVRVLVGVVAALGWIGGRSAEAAPLVPVQLTGVSATVTVELGGTLIGQTSSPIAVTGGSLVFDANPGSPSVMSFLISLAGNASSQINLSSAVDVGLGAFDQIIVDSAVLTSIVSASYGASEIVPGFYQFFGVPGVPGDPVASVLSSLTLSNSGGGGPTSATLPFPVGSLSGTLLFTGTNPGDVLDFGLIFPIATFTTTTGQLLQIKGDLLITGTVVPEPDAALLMGLALLCVAARVRSREGVGARDAR